MSNCQSKRQPESSVMISIGSGFRGGYGGDGVVFWAVVRCGMAKSAVGISTKNECNGRLGVREESRDGRT